MRLAELLTFLRLNQCAVTKMDNDRQPEKELNNETAQNQTEETLSEETSHVNQESPESFETIAGSDKPKIESDLLKLQDELAEAKDKYLRLYSEFENFRRRTAREKLEMIQGANEQVVKWFLPVMDDFERAEKSFQGSNPKDLEGLMLISNKFRKILEQCGVKAMDLQAGSDFDADVHDAITQIPAPEEKLKGKIVDVVEKGYLLNEKVIRHAKVVVGQ